MRLGLVAAVLALAFAGALVAGARERGGAHAAQEECADPGFVTDYNTFVLGDHRVTNDSVDGRMAVGRDAEVTQFSVGNRLEADASRVDMLVGRDLTASNAGANKGSVTYGRTLTGQMGALGTVTQDTLPFDMSQTFIALRSAQLLAE